MSDKRVTARDFPSNARCPIMKCVYNKSTGYCDNKFAPSNSDASCYNVPNWFILQMMNGSEELASGAELSMWPWGK